MVQVEAPPKQQLSQQQEHGHLGGVLAGKLGDNKYTVGYAVDARSICRYAGCKIRIEYGSLRLGKIPPALRAQAVRTQWHHPACIFKSFSRMTKQTKTIESVNDISGFSKLEHIDQLTIASLCQTHCPDNNLADTTYTVVAPTPPNCPPNDNLRSDTEEPERKAVEPATNASSEPFVRGDNLFGHHINAPLPVDFLRSVYDLKAIDVAAKISSLGIGFNDIAQKVEECGIDGRYIMSRSVEQFDEMLTDFGIDDSNTGRQKRRRLCYELGLTG